MRQEQHAVTLIGGGSLAMMFFHLLSCLTPADLGHCLGGEKEVGGGSGEK